MQTLFLQILNKYTEMSLVYDEETEHSNKKKKQDKWTLFIQTELKRLEEKTDVIHNEQSL